MNKILTKKWLHRSSLGFSLIEIMVVVVILGILASIVVPKMMRHPDEARRDLQHRMRAAHGDLRPADVRHLEARIR